MSVRVEVPIVRGRDNQPVTALLVTMGEKHLDDFEVFWKARLRASEQEDQFWDWELKQRVYLSSTNYESYAIEYEQITQGLMLIETQGHRSQVEPRPAIGLCSLPGICPLESPRLTNSRGVSSDRECFAPICQVSQSGIGL